MPPPWLQEESSHLEKQQHPLCLPLAALPPPFLLGWWHLGASKGKLYPGTTRGTPEEGIRNKNTPNEASSRCRLLVVTNLPCKSGAVLVYTTPQLGPVLGAPSGISGGNCWGKEFHCPVLANALLFSGVRCCWELDLISACRKCLSFSVPSEGKGELIQADVGTNPLVKAGPDPIICSAEKHVPRHTKPSQKTWTVHLSSPTKNPASSALRRQKERGEGISPVPHHCSWQGKDNSNLLTPRQRGAPSTISQQSQAQPGHEPDPGCTQGQGRSCLQ